MTGSVVFTNSDGPYSSRLCDCVWDGTMRGGSGGGACGADTGRAG